MGADVAFLFGAAFGVGIGVSIGSILCMKMRNGRCRHDRIRTIYGDEINGYDGNRSLCVDCGAAFSPFAETRPTAASGDSEGGAS